MHCHRWPRRSRCGIPRSLLRLNRLVDSCPPPRPVGQHYFGMPCFRTWSSARSCSSPRAICPWARPIPYGKLWSCRGLATGTFAKPVTVSALQRCALRHHRSFHANAVVSVLPLLLAGVTAAETQYQKTCSMRPVERYCCSAFTRGLVGTHQAAVR